MKFLILDCSQEENKKTGEVFYIMKAFGDVSKFGKTSKEAINIRLNDSNQFNKYKSKVGQETDLNIILPYSDYSYSLSD